MSTFKDPERAAQLISFEMLKWGNKGFSDIDAVLDWQGKFFVFVETKFYKGNLHKGQRILLENLCKQMKVPCVAIYCTHAIEDTNQIVNLASCRVKEVFWNGSWAKPDPKNDTRVGELLHKLLKQKGLI
jgi:hypothetical protein